MPTVREYETALKGNPADTEAFVALRKAYRQGQKYDKLVTLYEVRAQALEDGPKAAELFYLAAELRLDQLDDAQGAEADLANAVDRDPSHIRAAARLKDIYREQGRTADYMVMLEMEAAAVARTRDPARIAELQSEMNQLFVNHFARLERSVRNPQRPGKLDADQVKSIESARKIYRALGDYRSVVRLYELELEGTSDAKRRGDLLLGLGRVLAEKLEELDAAAQRLGEVVRLRPRDEKALELLASIYANPNWIGADGLDRAAAIYYQVARRRQETGDAENAVAALRKALHAVPGHRESSDLLERVYYDGKRFQELDRYYRERISAAADQTERIDFLYKRAQLAEGEIGDKAEAQRVYSEIATLEPPTGPASERLLELYAESHDYAKLAELREKQLAVIAEPADRVKVMTELAALQSDRLGDREQAAVYLHAILQLDPDNEPAQTAYASHFRDKGDWGALADLLEFTYEQAHTRNVPKEDLIARLEEVAAVAEKNLGDADRAVEAWRRIEDLEPTYVRAREAQRRLLLKTKNWDRMAALLEREAALQTELAQKHDTLRRVAQIQREKLNNSARAIEIYKGILRADPKDPVALRSLVEIHERDEDWAGLAQTLREQIELTPAKQERISLLRRLLSIYDEKLSDLKEGTWAATEILKEVPGDRDTLSRFEGILERGGDSAQLVQVLEQHARAVANSDEKIQLVRRMAELLQGTLNDLPKAAQRWEEVARLDPDDSQALDALTTLYGKLDAHADLARILDLQIERVVADPAQQAEYLRRLSQLAEGPLGDVKRAQRTWEKLLELLPADAEALESLSRIYSGEGDWSTLIRILERQIPLANEPARAVELALLRAQILDERLHNQDEAASALEQVVAELDPRNLPAHERLRALYERASDWSQVIKVAERQLFLTEDPAQRAPRALELGVLWRDRLGDQKKAVAAFERALEIDAENVEALRALAPLYSDTGNWQRLIFTDEKMLEKTTDRAERRRLMMEIARLAEDELGDPRLAFEWFKRLYAEDPDDAEALQLVDRVAEKHGLYDDAIQVYEGARARASEPIEQLAASLKIARICEEKLDDPARAFATLRDALPADPGGGELLPKLERLAARTGDWTGLLDIYARVARGRPELADRVDILRMRAEVRERHLNDPAGALEEFLRSFALAPANEATQEEILRLARATGRWEDALKVQGQLFALAEDQPTKLTVARNAAYLVEHEVKDLVRAFRAYLNAFRLAPDDPELTAHLWRLAAAIGRYETAEPPVAAPAPVAAAPVAETAAEDDERPEETETEAAALVVGEEVLDDGTDEVDTGAETTPARRDDVAGDAVRADAAADEAGSAGANEDADADADADEDDSTNEVVADDLVDEELADADLLREVDPADESIPNLAAAAALTPPPPPHLPPPPPPPAPRRPAANLFQSPWEEFAQTYESLPANDAKERHGRLLKIAELWERGAKDIPRALGALERAFRLEPGNATVRELLGRIGKEHGEWDRIADIFLGARDDFGPIEMVVDLHREVAHIRQSLGHDDKAEEMFREILSLKSDDSEALDYLENLTRAQERWGDLANLLEKRTSNPTESLPRGPARRAKFRELADLYAIRLERPYEAIDTLERYVVDAQNERDDRDEPDDQAPGDAQDVEAAPPRKWGGDVADVEEIIKAYDALTKLYSRVGLWAKVVEGLQRQTDLTADPQKARDLRWRVAMVYEKELGLSERAAEAYEAILAQLPDDAEALSALDRLHEAHGHFDDLQEVLGRRAALATGDERLQLVRRRAKILEDRLGNPEAAASCLRELGEEAIRDDELLAALLRNLRRAGLAQEAARALSQKIEIERKRKGKAAAARVADLNLQLSVLRLDDLNDPAAAREGVEAALAASPEDPAALAALARLHLKENDFAGYAETRVREARAHAGKPEAVEALLDAGRVFREQVSSPDRARACFEEALAADPENAESLRALAALLTSQGAWDEAKSVLGRQLALAPTPETRAAVLTDLGRAAWEGSNDAAEAQRYLDEALTLVPDHLPAVVTIADIYFKENQWENAEKRLTEAVRKLRGQPQQMVRLYQRLAEVHEKLGKLDEAYRQLLEADRMSPGQLLTKLSLGENRYRAGKWREAALHLGGLADHPDAALYPDDVADALAHGAQSEVKLRRPERALALYEAALRLRAGHRASLRAMADLAVERGEKHQAATYLRRLADDASDPAERAALFEELGDRLTDVDAGTQALAAYNEALKLAGMPGEAEVPLLEKTLKLQRATGDSEGAAQTSTLLIALVSDPDERAQRRRDAALLMMEGGDETGAADLVLAGLDENPQDEKALATLCEVWGRLGKDAPLAKRLAKVLPSLPPPADDPSARALRADLWQRLGQLRVKRAPDDALKDFQRVIELQPERLSARESLAALYGDAPEHADAAALNHRMLLASDIARPDSLRALAASYAARGLIDRARCCLEALDLLGFAEPDDLAFLQTHPAPDLKPEDPYAAVIDDTDRHTYLAIDEATLMAEVFSCLWEGAPGLIGQRIEDFGVTGTDKISPMSDLDLGKIYGQVAKALGNKKTALYASTDAAASELTMVVQSPPALIAGPGLAEGAAHAEIRFELGRGIELTRPEYILAAGVQPKQFAQLFSSVLKAFHPRHSKRRATTGDAGADQATKLKKNVPYKVSKRLVELFSELGTTSWSSVRWRTVVRHTGNRAGLLLCGDLKTAARIMLREAPGATASESSAEEFRRRLASYEPLRDLLHYAISEEYFHLREKLGTAVASAAAA